MSAKTATLNVRVDPVAKKQAESVLDNIGISMSAAINMTLKSIARNKRLPEETTSLDVCPPGILDIADLTDEEILAHANEIIANSDPAKDMPFDEFAKNFKWNQ